jgi:hypothetical protein
MPKKTGLTEKVREIAQEFKFFSAGELNYTLGVKTGKDAEKVRAVIIALRRRGEIRIIRRGRYRYCGKAQKKRTKSDIVWHLIRSHRHFKSNQIETLSGMHHENILKYLRCLVVMGILKKTSQQTWKLIKDPGPETPITITQCQKPKKKEENDKEENDSSGSSKGK